ncbi:MAG: hypothetical protein AAF821_09375 [Cyanobacteria bacterium P01_D01_bin.156]
MPTSVQAATFNAFLNLVNFEELLVSLSSSDDAQARLIATMIQPIKSDGGGSGIDTFVLAVGEGTDTIVDFQTGMDLIGLAEGLSLGQLTQTVQDSDLLLSIASETLALVQGVTALNDESFVQL